MSPSLAVVLALALATLTAMCAKICFRLTAETEKQQSEAHVGETKR
jgi:hypothetical protein